MFPAMGAAMTDNDLAAVESYGGVVFGYNDTIVRLWLPDAATGAINTAGCSVRSQRVSVGPILGTLHRS